MNSNLLKVNGSAPNGLRCTQYTAVCTKVEDGIDDANKLVTMTAMDAAKDIKVPAIFVVSCATLLDCHVARASSLGDVPRAAELSCRS